MLTFLSSQCKSDWMVRGDDSCVTDIIQRGPCVARTVFLAGAVDDSTSGCVDLDDVPSSSQLGARGSEPVRERERPGSRGRVNSVSSGDGVDDGDVVIARRVLPAVSQTIMDSAGDDSATTSEPVVCLLPERNDERVGAFADDSAPVENLGGSLQTGELTPRESGVSVDVTPLAGRSVNDGSTCSVDSAWNPERSACDTRIMFGGDDLGELFGDYDESRDVGSSSLYRRRFVSDSAALSVPSGSSVHPPSPDFLAPLSLQRRDSGALRTSLVSDEQFAPKRAKAIALSPFASSSSFVGLGQLKGEFGMGSSVVDCVTVAECRECVAHAFSALYRRAAYDAGVAYVSGNGAGGGNVELCQRLRDRVKIDCVSLRDSRYTGVVSGITHGLEFSGCISSLLSVLNHVRVCARTEYSVCVINQRPFQEWVDIDHWLTGLIDGVVACTRGGPSSCGSGHCIREPSATG
jgi:hypothetical protein